MCSLAFIVLLAPSDFSASGSQIFGAMSIVSIPEYFILIFDYGLVIAA
jgi:hypothetical protein